MDFLEAAETAKKDPGARLTRGDSGLFAAYLQDGRCITSLHQMQSDGDASNAQGADGEPRALHALVLQVTALARQQGIQQAEIIQLRQEVNSLKTAVARIPDSEWSRYEEEHRTRREAQKLSERERIMTFVREGTFGYEKLYLVLDNASTLELSVQDIELIRAEILRNRPTRPSPESFVVIHAKTDGE